MPMISDIIAYLRTHPESSSRDVANALCLQMQPCIQALMNLYRDGKIERSAGTRTRWSVRPPAMPSISVSGEAYARWMAEANRRGVPLAQLVSEALVQMTMPTLPLGARIVDTGINTITYEVP